MGPKFLYNSNVSSAFLKKKKNSKGEGGGRKGLGVWN